jgi:hypothetical protein
MASSLLVAPPIADKIAKAKAKKPPPAVRTKALQVARNVRGRLARNPTASWVFITAKRVRSSRFYNEISSCGANGKWRTGRARVAPGVHQLRAVIREGWARQRSRKFVLLVGAIAPTGTTKAHRRYRDHLWTFAVYRSPVDV